MKTGIIGLPQVGKIISVSDSHQGASFAASATRAMRTSASPKCPTTGSIGSQRITTPRNLRMPRSNTLIWARSGRKRSKNPRIWVIFAKWTPSFTWCAPSTTIQFRTPAPIDPLRDIKNVEFDLMVSDLGQIEKRMERVEKDLKKMRSADIEKEFELLKRAKAHLETERPLRELEMTPEDKKRFRGFMFLSEKPILYVLNISESTELGKDLENAVQKYKLGEVASRPNAGATAICGKVEAELSEMCDADAAEFLSSYGLTESGLTRLIRKTYELLGLISFFTIGEDECRAWTIPVNTRAVTGRRGDSLGSGKALHPRRNYPLGPVARSRL